MWIKTCFFWFNHHFIYEGVPESQLFRQYIVVATKAKLRLQYWWIGGVQNGYLARDNLAMVSLVALFSDGELNVEGNVPELAGAGVGVELELVPWVHFYHLGGGTMMKLCYTGNTV